MKAPRTVTIGFASDYNALPAGTYITTPEQMAAIMPGAPYGLDGFTISPQLLPDAYQIVAGGKNGGNCLRMHYPANQVGRDPRWWTIKLGVPPAGVPVNLEWDFMFEAMADLTGDGGKPGPAGINWGTQNDGLRQFQVWRSDRGTNNKPFVPCIQDQRNGNQYIQPVYYTKPNIVFGQWYHWRYQMLGGPQGFCKFWLDGVFLDTTTTSMGNSQQGDNVFIDMGFWAGGGEGSGPPTEFWTRNDNVKVYTGDAPDPPPIEEMKEYHIEGRVWLKPVTP